MKNLEVLDDDFESVGNMVEKYAANSAKCLGICVLIIIAILICVYILTDQEPANKYLQYFIFGLYVTFTVVNLTGFTRGISAWKQQDSIRILVLIGLFGNSFLLLCNIGMWLVVCSDLATFF